MKIALVGYGKMGRMIERSATERGHTVVARFNTGNNLNGQGLMAESLAGIDAAIEFSTPETALQTERLELRLQRATFDPLLQTLALPADLSQSAYPSDGSGYYLVQFRGPILPEWKEALQKQGVILFDYVPQFTFIVRMNSATAARVQSLDPVRWVGLYQPAFRLSTDLDQVIAAQPADDKRAGALLGHPMLATNKLPCASVAQLV